MLPSPADLLRNRVRGNDEERARQKVSQAMYGGGMPGSAPRSPFLGERDYLDDKRARGALAELDGARVRADYGSRGSMPMSPERRPSLEALSGGGGGDNIDRAMRLAALEGNQIQNARLGRQRFLENTNDDPYFAQKRGDVRRSQVGQDIISESDARNNAYRTDSALHTRQAQAWDEEDSAKRMFPYSAAHIRVAGEADKQQAINEREALKAYLNYQGRIGGAAIGAQGRIGAADIGMGGDPSTYSGPIGEQFPDPSERMVSEADIAEIARARNVDPALVRDYFTRQGYQVPPPAAPATPTPRAAPRWP